MNSDKGSSFRKHPDAVQFASDVIADSTDAAAAASTTNAQQNNHTGTLSRKNSLWELILLNKNVRQVVANKYGPNNSLLMEAEQLAKEQMDRSKQQPDDGSSPMSNTLTKAFSSGMLFKLTYVMKNWLARARAKVARHEVVKQKLQELMIEQGFFEFDSSNVENQADGGQNGAARRQSLDYIIDETTQGVEHMITEKPNKHHFKSRQLMKNERIEAAINRWWDDMYKEEVCMGPTDDGISGTFVLTKEIYVNMVTLIYELLIPSGSIDQAREVAELDWKNDAQGKDYMAYRQFFVVTFDLADIWCEQQTVDEYYRFIKILHKRLADECHSPSSKVDAFMRTYEFIDKKEREELLDLMGALGASPTGHSTSWSALPPSLLKIQNESNASVSNTITDQRRPSNGSNSPHIRDMRRASSQSQVSQTSASQQVDPYSYEERPLPEQEKEDFDLPADQYVGKDEARMLANNLGLRPKDRLLRNVIEDDVLNEDMRSSNNTRLPSSQAAHSRTQSQLSGHQSRPVSRQSSVMSSRTLEQEQAAIESERALERSKLMSAQQRRAIDKNIKQSHRQELGHLREKLQTVGSKFLSDAANVRVPSPVTIENVIAQRTKRESIGQFGMAPQSFSHLSNILITHKLKGNSAKQRVLALVLWKNISLSFRRGCMMQCIGSVDPSLFPFFVSSLVGLVNIYRKDCIWRTEQHDIDGKDTSELKCSVYVTQEQHRRLFPAEWARSVGLQHRRTAILASYKVLAWQKYHGTNLVKTDNTLGCSSSSCYATIASCLSRMSSFAFRSRSLDSLLTLS